MIITGLDSDQSGGVVFSLQWIMAEWIVCMVPTTIREGDLRKWLGYAGNGARQRRHNRDRAHPRARELKDRLFGLSTTSFDVGQYFQSVAYKL